MKYCVENDLCVFDFHDAIFSFAGFDGKDLTVSARKLNVHKDIPPNPHDFDMEIDNALITFQNFRSVTYEPGRAWKKGEDGAFHPVGPQVLYSGEEAMTRFIGELKENFWVYSFIKEENGGYYLDGCGMEPYLEMCFDFDAVTVCWDAYKQKAWYELHRKYQYRPALQTSEGEESVELTVNTREEAVYYEDAQEPPFTVNIGCQYKSKQYWGYGTDELWIDAFADLQRKLPEGVFLKCCVTCAHGNHCPVGNVENEIFCTKDVLITQKSDLYFYTEDEEERAKRIRQNCDLCADYRMQCEDIYTYNNYLYFLKHE